jgi:hypothetical protein
VCHFIFISFFLCVVSCVRVCRVRSRRLVADSSAAAAKQSGGQGDDAGDSVGDSTEDGAHDGDVHALGGGGGWGFY